MEYSEEAQSYLDIDWFAVDKEGNVIHFASGGGQLPYSVALSKEDNEKIAIYIRTLPVKSENVKISPVLGDEITFSNEQEKDRYLRDFTMASKKGMFSFDKSSPGDFLNKNYHLVTIPGNLLKISDLPSDIALVINRTKIKKQILGTYKLSVEEIK